MRLLFSLFTIFSFLQIQAQEEFTLPELEADLVKLGDKVIVAVTQEERLAANTKFDSILNEMLHMEGAFDYPFEQVKNLSKITAESGEFRLFTWLVPLRDGTYSYFGYSLTKKKGGLEVEELNDQSANMETPEYAWLKKDKWFGAIYYQTFQVKHKKNSYQIFLGYRPGDRDVQEKIVEVVQLDGNKLMFGAKIFETPMIFDFKYEQRPYRLRFRYSKKVVASVKYDPREKMIVMDHLSPPDASFMRQWRYYGPDFSYDGLYWEDGKFHLKTQITFTTDIKPFVQEVKPQQGLKPKKEGE